METRSPCFSRYSFKEDDKAQISPDQATCDAGEEWVPRNKWMNRPAGASSESTDIRTVPYYAETQGRH